MSYSPHAIEGLGFRLSDIQVFLDAEKLRELLIKYKGCNLIFSNEDYSEYVQHNNSGQLEFLEPWFEEYESNIFGLLEELEATGLLVASKNGDGEYYLLYERQYLWNRREGEFATEKEARSYLCDFLLRFTLPEVTAEDVAPFVRFYDERAD